jgi:hypothetical protein
MRSRLRVLSLLTMLTICGCGGNSDQKAASLHLRLLRTSKAAAFVAPGATQVAAIEKAPCTDSDPAAAFVRDFHTAGDLNMEVDSFLTWFRSDHWLVADDRIFPAGDVKRSITLTRTFGSWTATADVLQLRSPQVFVQTPGKVASYEVEVGLSAPVEHGC